MFSFKLKFFLRDEWNAIRFWLMIEISLSRKLTKDRVLLYGGGMIT